MEISHEILDAMDIGNDKDVMEVLKHAISEENVILESETTEDSEETEIEEIIEIIEEVEEEKEELQDDTALVENEDKAKTDMGVYTFEETHSGKKGEKKYGNHKSNSKQVIRYDVDEDWQDEDMEEEEQYEVKYERNLSQSEEFLQELKVPNNNRKYVNKQQNSLQMNRSESLDHIESMDKIENSKLTQEFENNKPSSVKALQMDKVSDANYIKMEHLNENSLPVDGAIYYEGENMETVYVAENTDDNEQYSYETAAIENEEQAWEASNSDTNQNQEKEVFQDQIFLHEDEEGQLYFKDDTGALQPVYLTEDGHYAIADTSDDQGSKDLPTKSQQSDKQIDEESYSATESELKSSQNNRQNVVPATDIDNEDNTVTISLIISEDEHGQKRTQVIIPTTDNLKCDICNKSFKTSFQLLRHNRLKHAREEDITTRNFPCDLCPKRYPDQNSLARHRKTHTGDRPFQCLECHKNFPTSTALRRHMTLHNSQSRPLPCIYCGRRFVDKASLVKHEQSHLAGDQRTHTCDVCHKSFLHATDLSLHKKYHDPDKKFDCEVCGREFNRLNNLQRHMMVHQQQGANQEILSCDVCGITYKFMSSLTRHMVTTHMNPEKLRQQAEEQRRKRENNYRRYLENRKMYETQQASSYNPKRTYHTRLHSESNDDEVA
ncbi:zinc finger protein 62-like isoform X2 [Ceratina calcarata]|uniref:Zinc finger protein 62-like isoform X2 n=1 Tax=Ceratina calcarata TaxID=156304 RepID=A0AAJ7S9X7_9HYME|nr:zinc finger protein 62-like isoform X2 [Ceratina calcarata]